MPRVTSRKCQSKSSTFKHARRSNDQEICYEILLVLTFFSVSTAAYEKIILTTAMYVFLAFSGIFWHIGCSTLIMWAKVYALIALGRYEMSWRPVEILAVSEEGMFSRVRIVYLPWM
jgi:hypothetical protein